MTIETNDAILKFGTQDKVTSSAGTVADDAFSASGDTVDWINDDDASLAAAVLKLQFDTTMPTVGIVDLFGQLLNIEGANDAGAPDGSHEHVYLGSFPIDFGVANDVDFYTTLTGIYFRVPQLGASQTIHFFIRNNATAQTIGTGWDLWITPVTEGPKA